MKGLVFTYLLTAFGAVNGLFYPYIGVLVYVLLSIIKPEVMWAWSVGPGNFSRIVGVSLLLGWLFNGLGDWRLGKGWGVVGLLLAYYGWMGVSTLTAIDSSRGFGLLVFFAKVILPFLAAISTVRTVNELRALAWVIVLGMGYVAFELNLSYLGGYNRVWEEGFGMDNNCVAIAMVTGVGLAFFLGMGSRKWWVQGLAFGCAALMAHVILLSYSRGGMIALLVCGAVAFYLTPKTPKHYAIVLVGVLLMIRLAGPKVQERFVTAFTKQGGQMEASAESRLKLWTDATDTFSEQPLLGVGPDNWGLVAPRYGWPRGKEVHSLWVQNLAEVGLPGTLFLLGFFGLCCYRLLPLTRESTPVPDPWMRDAARMVIAALAGFVVAAQFVTIKYLELPYYVVLLGVGLLKLQAQMPAVQTAAVRATATVPVYLPRMRRAIRPESKV